MVCVWLWTTNTSVSSVMMGMQSFDALEQKRVTIRTEESDGLTPHRPRCVRGYRNNQWSVTNTFWSREVMPPIIFLFSVCPRSAFSFCCVVIVGWNHEVTKL